MKHFIRKLTEKIDKRSPWPLFYQFVMSKAERTVFDEAIMTSSNYLEFGMGGSTLRALQKSKAIIYSVESSPEWVSHMTEYSIIRSNLNKRVFITTVNIGSTREWSIPASNSKRNIFPDYSSNVFREMNKDALDLALVDGRFRVACVLKIILECHQTEKLKLMIHDFWNREEYHVALKYLDTLKQVDSLGMFSVKKNVDLKAAEKDYQKYKFISD